MVGEGPGSSPLPLLGVGSLLCERSTTGRGEPGERWGSRSRCGVELVVVEVLRLRAKGPPRVQVEVVELDQSAPK